MAKTKARKQKTAAKKSSIKTKTRMHAKSMGKKDFHEKKHDSKKRCSCFSWKFYSDYFKKKIFTLDFSAMMLFEFVLLGLLFVGGIVVMGYLSRLPAPNLASSPFLGMLQASDAASITSLMQKVVLMTLLFFIFVEFAYALTRSLIWCKLLKKKFTVKYWLRMTLLSALWFVIFILPMTILTSFVVKLYSEPFFYTEQFLWYYLYLFIVYMLMVIVLMLYCHFTNIVFYRFTKHNTYKALWHAYKLGFLKMKHFIKPNLIVFVVFVVMSFASLILLILPEILQQIISTIMIYGFVVWYRMYYTEKIEKAGI